MKLVSVTFTNNRETVIGRMVSSVAPFVDEVIILDTGVTDGTLDKCKEVCEFEKRDLRVVSWPWQNDFSKARNAALQAAADAGADWCIMLDSDEWLDLGGDDLQTMISACDKEGFRHIALKNSNGVYLQPRLFKLPASGHFEGPTHEAYAPWLPAMTAEHARFCDDPKTPEQAKEKHDRDRALLEAKTQEEPTASRWWYYLADTYYCLGMLPEAMQAFNKCAELPGWDEQQAWSCYRLAAIQCERKEWDGAVDSCALGLTKHPGICELPWLAAYACHQQGKQAQAICWARMSVALGKHEGIGKNITRISFTNPMAQWEGPYQILCSAYRAMGQKKEADMAAVKFSISRKYREAEGK